MFATGSDALDEVWIRNQIVPRDELALPFAN